MISSPNRRNNMNRYGNGMKSKVSGNTKVNLSSYNRNITRQRVKQELEKLKGKKMFFLTPNQKNMFMKEILALPNRFHPMHSNSIARRLLAKFM